MALFGLGASAWPQVSVNPSDLVRSALSQSPKVRAGVAETEAIRGRARALRAGFNPKFEVTAGVGFPDGDTMISQELDVFGKRASEAMVVEREVAVGEARLGAVRQEVAFDALSAYVELAYAQDQLLNAQVALASAEAVRDVVKRQEEIGAVPAVQVTRAELQVLRARQDLQRAEGHLLQEQAEINSYLGKSLSEAVVASGWIEADLIEGLSQGRSAELLIAQAELGVAESRVRSIARESRPTLSAEIVSDARTLDRDLLRGGNFGFQLSFSMPLFDRGSSRFAVQAAESSRVRAEAFVEEATRRSDLSFVRAQIAVGSAREVLGAFESDVLPQGEAMLLAMQQGYDSGLVTLIEVLEAQHAMNRLRDDQAEARRTLRLAELRLLEAASRYPGMEARS